MTQQLEDLLRASTVRVLGESTSGAGFFIAPGRVLTCVHVVGDSAGLKVLWERDGHEPQLRDVSGRVAMLADKKRPLNKVDIDYPDIAVLEVRGLDGHPCVSIDLHRPSLGANFLTFGYPEEGGSVLLTPAELTYRGQKGVLPTVFLDLASDTIKPGMSGAPVLNLQTGEVCGVVVVSKNPAQPDGALAVPLSAMQKDLSEVLAANRTFHEQDRRWAEAAFNSEGLQPGPANRFQLEAYLRKVIDRNSQDAWPDRKRFGGPVLTPDTMERELRVIVIEPREPREIGADELTEQCQRLVFLGGPGSGKTWLAKRLARHCAQQSLEALRTGKSPEDVELPLYTTCSEFFKAGGSASEAAVSSALKFADLGSARVNTAIKALFAERDGPTLLIIDSLDEASGSYQPLLDADALPWRIVLTSRPNSWDHQLVPQDGNNFKKVAELQPLRYPEDVESIIADWFAGQPERGKDLAAQIARRPNAVELRLSDPGFHICTGGHAEICGQRANSCQDDGISLRLAECRRS